MIASLALALAVAAAASAPPIAPRLTQLDDGRCKVERPPVSTPKTLTPGQRVSRPPPAASAPVATAPARKPKPKPKARPKAAPSADEYVPCPPIRPPGLFSLIPPPDTVPPLPFVPALPPEGLFAPPGGPAVPCECFAGDEPRGGLYGGFGGGGGSIGGGGGGGSIGSPRFPPAIPVAVGPVPEPGIWAMLVAGVAVVAYRRREPSKGKLKC